MAQEYARQISRSLSIFGFQRKIIVEQACGASRLFWDHNKRESLRIYKPQASIDIKRGRLHRIHDSSSASRVKMQKFDYYLRTDVTQFDIFAREAGYIALIKKDEFRMLAKREPDFCLFLYKQLSIHALDQISQQFLRQNYMQRVDLEPMETQSKKILSLLEGLGGGKADSSNGFSHFWNQLEQRDKRALTTCASLIEMKSQDVLVRANQRGDQLFIVCQGEVMEYQNNRPGRIYRPGEVIGLQQFLTEQSYASNSFARSKCLLVRVTRANLCDIGITSGLSACSIIGMLVRFEASQIRHQFESEFPALRQRLQEQVEELVEELKNPKKPLSKKEQFTIPQIMGNYFEMDITKRERSKEEVSVEQHLIAPLYVLDIYKDMVAQRGYQLSEVKDRKDPMFISGLSILLREKVEEQRARQVEQKQEVRKAKKEGREMVEEEVPGVEMKQDAFEQLNDDYSRLREELEKSNEYIFLLEQQVLDLKEQVQNNKCDNQHKSARIQKYELHRELLRLNLIDEQQVPYDKMMKHKVTMFDTFKQQGKDTNKFSLTMKAADKMLHLSQSKHQNQAHQ